MSRCPKCNFESSSDVDCTRCGVVFSKFSAAITPAAIAKQRQRVITHQIVNDDESTPEEREYEKDLANPLAHLIALPAGVLVVLLSKLLVFPAMLLDGCRIWVHEFGHAFIGWFGSRAATPLGLGWTNIGAEKSWYVYGCFLFLLGITAYRSWRNGYFYLVFLALLAFIGQTYFTYNAPQWLWERTVSYSGIGGEFYLSGLLIASFHYRLPRGIRWDWLRYLILLIGCYALLTVFYHWFEISQHHASFPWGSLINGEEDGGGDMNRLVDEFGWSQKDIAGIYLRDGKIVTLFVLLHYGVQCLRYVPKLLHSRRIPGTRPVP